MHTGARSAFFILALISLAATITVIAPSAAAQELEGGETVANRARPGFDAAGIPVGGLTLLPTLGGQLRYFDNVFADDEVKIDDTAFILSPELTLNSRSDRHRAQVGGNADLARYADRETENYDDARLWALARMEAGPGEIEGELRLSRLHQERVTPDDLGCAEFAGEIVCTGLTEFTNNRAGIAYSWQPNRLLIRGDLRYTTFDFDDTQLPLGAGSISNDDRDRTRADLGLRLGYAVSPDYAVYFETRFDSIDFDQREDRDGFQRSSEGTEARLGMLLDFTGSTFGEFYVGYLEREFADPRFGLASGPTFGADLSWNVTGLTTLGIKGERTIDNTIVFGASGIFRSRIAVSADHELLRNLVLNAELGIGNDEFEGLDRDDDVSEFRLGGTYLMNRYMRVLFGYRFRSRDTSPETSPGRIFDVNEIFLQVVGQL
jgi:hypothetical protein